MKKKWWKERVFYQIYPRSFQDSDGDGIGDLRGIISRLDYLSWLGVGAVWLCPIYDSPNDDNGYDIRNYESILSDFGSLEDFRILLQEMHQRDIKLVMDLVVNHTSDEHAWFVESRSSKDNPRRDYYIWNDGKDGGAPNNWASHFCPSAWKLDQKTGQYYLHLFSEKQPDLNWENDQLREEIYKIINRWFDLGVDGFRMDVINLIAKKAGFPDGVRPGSSQETVLAYEHFANQPRFFDYMKEMRKKCFLGRDCLRLGETPFTSVQECGALVDEEKGIFDMVFPFELMEMDDGPAGKYDFGQWTTSDFVRITSEWQKATVNGWASLFWSNHDQARPVSRFGCAESEEFRSRSAKMLATALYLQRGTPFIFQGEELGMTNVPFPDVSYIRDIEAFNILNVSKKMGVQDVAWEAVLHKGRDNARTPMQWNGEKNAGFSKGEPWIMINPNYNEINVEAEKKDSNSILNFYRQLISLRKGYVALQYGDCEFCDIEDDVVCYTRKADDQQFIIMCNMIGSVKSVDFIPEGNMILGNCKEEHSESILLPYEARVYYVNKQAD